MLLKIISGGQTGADMGALLAGRQLGIRTGGCAPKGWLTENGPQETLLRSFGLLECEEDGYPARTRRNVTGSDGTLLVGPHPTGGTRLTYDLAKELKKPLFILDCVNPRQMTADRVRIEDFQSWVQHDHIKVLNVAGNRESQTPGIAEFTRVFLANALL